MHSYTESLRAQLDGTGIEVTELIPPAVATPADTYADLLERRSVPLKNLPGRRPEQCPAGRFSSGTRRSSPITLIDGKVP